MKYLLLALFGAAFVLPPIVAAASPTLTVTWTAPTKKEDGSLIAGTLTYQLYSGVSGKEVKLGVPVTASPYIVTTGIPAPGQTLCFQVTAILNGVESVRTPEACVTIPYPRPVSPTQITVTVK